MIGRTAAGFDLLDQIEDEGDMLVALRELWPQGEIVETTFGGNPTTVVYDLPTIYAILADKFDHFSMAPVFKRLSVLNGTGILTNYDWETWHPRRKVIVKPLGARAIGRFHERMVSIIDEELDRWPVGVKFDLHAQVKQLTLRVVADLLFTTDLTDDAAAIINRAVEAVHTWAESDPSNEDLDDPPEDFRAARSDLYGFIDSVIDSRDASDPGSDMVGILIAASADPQNQLDANAIRDEAVTLILAGHETVTNTISFAIDQLGRRTPLPAPFEARPVVDETLRLFPPVHVTSRLVIADTTIGDFTFRAGTEVMIPEYVLYRSDRYFEDPETFRPERWTDDSELHMVQRAYFPFLTGPKFCVGTHFALLEATETLERFVARFTHEMLGEEPWGREFALSFAPDRPMPCILHSRQHE